MPTIFQAADVAAEALQQIAEKATGERGRRAAVVALVLRVFEQSMACGGADRFLLRRAEREVDGIQSRAEAGFLRRLLALAEILDEDVVASRAGQALVEYGCRLETDRRLPESDAVLTMALTLTPSCAETALHAGRVARLQGDRERALKLYRSARRLDRNGGGIARLSAIGEAVVSADPEAGLSRVIRKAIAAGDAEAAGVGLEERARIRRARGARIAAARDLGFAAARFPDSVDRARVAHQLADIFVAADDPEAAREALLFALATGDPSQRDHARSRLHTVSRDMDDHVGMRRWRSYQRPALVSLSARSGVRSVRSAAPRVARWREHLEAAAGSRA